MEKMVLLDVNFVLSGTIKGLIAILQTNDLKIFKAT